MIPVLYRSITEGSVPAHFGVGALSDCLGATVEESRNGEYELVLEYAAGGIHAGDIEPLTIIKAKPNYTDAPQLFEVYKVGKVINGRFTINARHISYRLSNKLITTGSAGSCVAACGVLNAQAGNFNITTDKTTQGAFRVSEPSSVRSWFGGKAGSLLDVYGGEWKYDNFTASLLNARGADRGVTIRDGKNLTQLSQEISIENLATAVLPYYKDQDGNVTAGAKVSTGLILNPPRELAVDFSNDVDPESATPIITQLNNLATRYINNNNFTVAINSIELDFAQLDQLADRVDLCDTVKIYFDALGITATAKCVKTVWDVLRDRYESCTFGSARANIVDTITGQANELKDKPSRSYMAESIERATALITGNLGGYVILHDSNGDGTPDEVLIMNTPDITTATKVWRWNKNGLGYSSNGYAGPYGLAMTADGEIVADFITAGTLSGNRVRTGLIQSTNNALQIDLDTGTITAPAITLNGQDVENTIDSLVQTSVVTRYALSNSGATIPQSFPLTNPTQPTEQQPYLWSRTVYTYADGQTNTSYGVSVRGANGAPGADGAGLAILGNYDTMADLIADHPTGSAGEAYMVVTDLVVWNTNTNSWENVGRIQGPSGADGLWLAVDNDDTGANMQITYNAHLFKGVTDVTQTYNAVFVWQMVKESGVTELAANTPTVTVNRDAADYGAAIRCVCIAIITEDTLQAYDYATIQDYTGNDIQIIGANNVKLIGDTAIYKPYAIESEFQVLQDEISSRVTQTAFNSLENTVTTQGTLIQQNADAILLKADTTTVDAGLANKMGRDMSNRASSILIDSGQIRFDSNSIVVNSSQFTLDAQGNASFGGNLSAATLVIGGESVGIGDAINDAEAGAISAAATDATQKANTAASTAYNNSKTYTDSAASTTYNNAKNYTDTGLAGKVGNNEVRTKFAADTHSVTIQSGTVNFKANTLLVDSTQFMLDAQGNATFKGNLSAATINIGGDLINIGTAINDAEADAITAAASDATTKANNAKNQAISAAATDATTKANNAKSQAISAAATDATTKANTAQSNAIASAKSYTDTGLAGKVGNSEIRTKFAADTHSITIQSGSIDFTANTFSVDSTNLEITREGAVTSKDLKAVDSINLIDADAESKIKLEHTGNQGTRFRMYDENPTAMVDIWAYNGYGAISLNKDNGTQIASLGSSGLTLDGETGNRLVTIARGTSGGSITTNEPSGTRTATLFANNGGNLYLYNVNGDRNVLAYGSTGEIECVHLTQTSSRKVKENIEPITPEESAKVLELEAVRFDYKDKAKGTNQRGFIAEDVAEVLPNLVKPETEDTPARLDYVSIIPYLQDVLKRQQKEIDELKRQVEELKGDK